MMTSLFFTTGYVIYHLPSRRSYGLETLYAKCVAMTEPVGRVFLFAITFFEEFRNQPRSLPLFFSRIISSLGQEESMDCPMCVEVFKSRYVWASLWGVFDEPPSLSLSDLLDLLSDAFWPNRARLLAHLRENGLFLMRLPRSSKDDRELALVAVRQDGRAYNYLSERLKDDAEMRLLAARQNGLALLYIGPRISRECEYIRNMFKNYLIDLPLVYGRLYAHHRDLLDACLEGDTRDRWQQVQHLLSAIVQDEYFTKVSPEENMASMPCDDSVIQNILSYLHGPLKIGDYCSTFAQQFEDPFGQRIEMLRGRQYLYDNFKKLRSLSSLLVTNYRITLCGVRQNGRALQYAWDWFRKDPFLVSCALKQDELAQQYVHPELLERVEPIFRALRGPRLSPKRAFPIQDRKSTPFLILEEMSVALPRLIFCTSFMMICKATFRGSLNGTPEIHCFFLRGSSSGPFGLLREDSFCPLCSNHRTFGVSSVFGHCFFSRV